MIRQTFLTAALLCATPFAQANIGVREVAKGFDRPVWAGVPIGVEGKLWVMEQAGRVWIVDTKTGKREEKPFLDIHGEVLRKGQTGKVQAYGAYFFLGAAVLAAILIVIAS